MFDVPFRYGAGWDAAADRAEERVTVLSAPMNERLFGGEDSTGRMLMMNNEPFRIVGVLDNWHPVPTFYDLNNNPYDGPGGDLRAVLAGRFRRVGQLRQQQLLEAARGRRLRGIPCLGVHLDSDVGRAPDPR